MLIWLWRYAGSPTEDSYAEPKSVFRDLNEAESGAEILKAAAWAYAEGICIGLEQEDGLYLMPNICVGRADMAIMLWRLAGRPKAGGKMKYEDVGELGYPKGSDLYQAVLWITKEGIAKGYSRENGESEFGLTRKCMKEHVITYLYRVHEIIEG